MGKAIKADETGKKILYIIDCVQPIWCAELCRTLVNIGYNYTQPSISDRLDKYKAAGWITARRKRGGRVIFLSITDKGRGQLA
jgi:hypothetical protein